ncbi:MAG: AraC family transcriptional regulator [Alphaproteobacteria bacterium]|nr:AraC family transcriptional regulator [Alphaproteobacteria bacterium]
MTVTAESIDLAQDTPQAKLFGTGRALAPNQPKRVVLLLLPNFSMVSLGSAIDPLRAANVLSEARLFQWELQSVDGEPVSTANGTQVAVDGRLEAPDSSTLVICCGGVSSERFLDHNVFRIMRAHVAMGGELIGTSDAAFILARAGLLADGKCVIHWTCVDLFRQAGQGKLVSEDALKFAKLNLFQRFPPTAVASPLYSLSGNRFFESA